MISLVLTNGFPVNALVLTLVSEGLLLKEHHQYY